MAEDLSEFTFKLLDNIRGKEELELILNKSGKENQESYYPLDRLDVAIKNGEKKVLFNYLSLRKLILILTFSLLATQVASKN